MSGLDDLYQEIIIDHSKRPRNFGPIQHVSAKAEGYNPLCGDRVTIQLKLEDDRITEIGFQGSGCAISTASASLLTECLKGRTRSEAEGLFERFHNLLTGEATPADLGKLAVFSGVREYPARVKCATLAWHTLRAALRESAGQISTE
jgi:nitrogen fixation protein NifU and related proteins